MSDREFSFWTFGFTLGCLLGIVAVVVSHV